MEKDTASCFYNDHSCLALVSTRKIMPYALLLDCSLMVKQKDSSQETIISLMGYVHPHFIIPS